MPLSHYGTGFEKPGERPVGFDMKEYHKLVTTLCENSKTKPDLNSQKELYRQKLENWVLYNDDLIY